MPRLSDFFLKNHSGHHIDEDNGADTSTGRTKEDQRTQRPGEAGRPERGETGSGQTPGRRAPGRPRSHQGQVQSVCRCVFRPKSRKKIGSTTKVSTGPAPGRRAGLAGRRGSAGSDRFSWRCVFHAFFALYYIPRGGGDLLNYTACPRRLYPSNSEAIPHSENLSV